MRRFLLNALGYTVFVAVIAAFVAFFMLQLVDVSVVEVIKQICGGR